MKSDVDQAVYGRDIDRSEGNVRARVGPGRPSSVNTGSLLNSLNARLNIDGSRATTWCDRVHVPEKAQGVAHSWETRGRSTPQPSGFWEAQARPEERAHGGLRTQYIRSTYDFTGGAFGGYKRLNTPPMRGTRDPSMPIRKSKIGRQMLPVDTVTAVNGRPPNYPEVGRRGPVCPAGMLAANLEAEKRRRSEWTDGMMCWKSAPEVKVVNASQERLEAGPLYSSFGLPGKAHIKYFDPTRYMSKKWVAKMVRQGRVEELDTSKKPDDDTNGERRNSKRRNSLSSRLSSVL